MGVVMALTARILGESDRILQELVAKTGKSKIEIIDEALKSYRFHERMKLINKDYEGRRSYKKTWDQELEERNELEGTLLDGLEEY